MRRSSLLPLLLALLIAACTTVEPIPARTQVMLRISTGDEELLAQMDALRVAVRLNEGARWRAPVSKEFAASGLNWPVEIPTTPRVLAEASSEFEVVVDALRGGEVIAQARLVTSFVENEQRAEDLELYLCRNDQGIAVCAESDCVGIGCPVCSKSGSCEVNSPAEDAGEPIMVTDMDAAQDLDAANSMSDGDVQADAAETGATVVSEYALGVAGAPCAASLEQTLGCEGHASRKILKCQQGMWQVLQTCSATERCESRVGTNQGTCSVIPGACVGKEPGDICDGTARLECGIDLVNVTSRPCPEHTHCDASTGTKCVCDTGYEPDDQGGCRNPDNCPANACSGGHCVDGLSDWSCDCNQGFTGTGTKACAAVLHCPKDACTPGGTCNDTMNWSCQCRSGFTGTGTRACANTNDCPSDRCRSPNGVCADLVNGYRCDCNAGFSGTDCVNDICSPNPCRNGGTCSRTGNLCTCPVGFSGTNCATDACAPNPCQHGGACTRTSSGASCNCTGTGYQGNRCETMIDPCSGTTNACGGSCMTPLAHQPNESCTNGLLGACARTGRYVCQGTTTTVCNAPSVAGTAETCDGVDNDCDGMIDESATNAQRWYRDCDNDGYATSTFDPSCVKPSPTATCLNWLETTPQAGVNEDCDDRTVSYRPGAGFGYPVEANTSADLNCDARTEFQDFVFWPRPDSIISNTGHYCASGLSCAECWRAACQSDTNFFGCFGIQTNGEPRCSLRDRDQLVRVATQDCTSFYNEMVSQACR